MLDFNDIANLLIERWKGCVYQLSDQGEIEPPYYEDESHPEIPFYAIDWHQDGGEPHRDDFNLGYDQCRGVGIIRHSRGTQDPSVPVDTFAQTIEFALSAPSQYRDDIRKIFETFAHSLKSQAVQIGGTPMLFKSDSLPSYSKDFTESIVEGEDCKLFRVEWSVLCIQFPSLTLSNDYTMTMTLIGPDGETKESGKIEFTKITFSDEYETRAASETMETLRFRQNTRQAGASIDILCRDAGIDQSLLADILKGTSIGDTWDVTLRKGTQIVYSETWCRKSGTAVMAYGSFVALTATFQMGY